MSFLDKNKIIEEAFSYAGKVSVEKYNIINQANKILEKKRKKFFRDFISQDIIDKERESKEKEKFYSFEDLRKAQTPKQRLKIKKDIKKYFKELKWSKILNIKKLSKIKNSSDCLTDRLNFSEINSASNKYIKLNKDTIKGTKNNINIKGIKSPLNKNKYKYHNIHMKKQLEEDKNKINYNKKQNGVTYYPNFEYIYNKINIGPLWKRISERKKKLFDESGNELDKYYNNTNKINIKNFSFIDMAKQTQRNGFPINHNLRQRYESKFIPKYKKDIIWKKIYKKPLISKSPFSRDDNDYRLKMILRHKLDKKYFSTYKPYMDKFISFEKCKSIPNFDRCLGREYLEKLARKKFIDFNDIYYPNYNSVNERVKMMVIYNKRKIKNIEEKFKGIRANELFNLTNSFEQIYGHKFKVVPKFEKMVTRPNDKVLPSFMKDMFNKMSCYLITDKTLKLNNYSNGNIHYDIYKKAKISPIDKENNSLLESEFDSDYLSQEEKEKEKENKINIKKNKGEIEKIIKKMNKLYRKI